MFVCLFCPVRGVNLSESEAEQDGEHNITELPQVYSGRGNMRAQQSAVRLTEVRKWRVESIGVVRYALPNKSRDLAFVYVFLSDWPQNDAAAGEDCGGHGRRECALSFY